jgi:hypothetical protein
MPSGFGMSFPCLPNTYTYTHSNVNNMYCK